MKDRLRSSSIPIKLSSERAASESSWDVKTVVAELQRVGTKRNVDGMARFGIRAVKVYGVSKPKLDELAKKIGRNHDLDSPFGLRGFMTRKFWRG